MDTGDPSRATEEIAKSTLTGIRKDKVIAFLPQSSSDSFERFSQAQAVGVALLGYTLWVLSDASLKFAGASFLPSYEVTGALGISITIILLIYGVCRRNLNILWPHLPARLVLRSFLDVLNAFGVVVAVRRMPLALFYILIFCAPMLSTLLAALLLGETLQPRKVLTIVGGFIGIVVAVNPLHLSRSPEAIGVGACLVCVSSFSVNVVWSRKLAQTEAPESLAFFSGVMLAAVGLLATLIRPVPVSARLAGVIAVAGLSNVLGSLCFFRALRSATASSVSQCHYSQLLTGALIGFLLWHEKLCTSTLLGGVLIIAAGFSSAALSSEGRSYQSKKQSKR